MLAPAVAGAAHGERVFPRLHVLAQFSFGLRQRGAEVFAHPED
jgi:hypothetical protein